MTENEELKETAGEPESEPTFVEQPGEFQDREVACRECGATFAFTAGEQAFYQSRGFTNDPTRCPECRNSRRSGRRTSRSDEEGTRVVCAACGLITTVPFRPSGGKPVYCRDCYAVKT